jgi:hypothetical protein
MAKANLEILRKKEISIVIAFLILTIAFFTVAIYLNVPIKLK